MIRKSEIGKTYVVSYKGLKFTAHITNDPSQFKYYRTLGLDVFVKHRKKKKDDSSSESDNND